jgi:aspartokinase-like uncharacterized kinase
MRPTAVVKLGGSLLDFPQWPQRLEQFLQSYQHHCVIVVGGGRTADLIRDWQSVHGFDDVSAHELALHAMQLNARAGVRILDAQLVESRDEARHCWQHEVLPVLDVVASVSHKESEDFIPADWNATSDSIAAFIAGDWELQRLAILKSVDLPDGDSLESAAEKQLVDPLVPGLVQHYSLVVDWRNLRAE